MQKRIIVLMSSVLFILFFISTSESARLTRSQREEKLRHFKYAYESNQMIYRVSDEELSDFGITQIKQKYRWILKDSKGGVFVARPIRDVFEQLKREKDRELRVAWEEIKAENKKLRGKVANWIRREEENLGLEAVEEIKKIVKHSRSKRLKSHILFCITLKDVSLVVLALHICV